MTALFDRKGRVHWERVNTEADLMAVATKIGIGDGTFGHPDLYKFLCVLIVKLGEISPETSWLRLLAMTTWQRLRALESRWDQGLDKELHVPLGLKRPTKKQIAVARKGFDAYVNVERERLKRSGDIHAAFEAAAPRLKMSPATLSRVYYGYKDLHDYGNAIEVRFDDRGNALQAVVGESFAKSKRKLKKTSQ